MYIWGAFTGDQVKWWIRGITKETQGKQILTGTKTVIHVTVILLIHVNKHLTLKTFVIYTSASSFSV